MTSFAPHPAYAEDQPYSRTILTAHVLSRGVFVGTAVSFLTSSLSAAYARFRSRPQVLRFGHRFILHASRGSPIGVAATAVMLTGRMWGKDEIEWQDRAWRLIENRSQRETDNWMIGGSVAGAGASLFLASRGKLPVTLSKATTIIGGTSIGTFLGTVGFMGSQAFVKRDGDAAKKTVKEAVNSF